MKAIAVPNNIEHYFTEAVRKYLAYAPKNMQHLGAFYNLIGCLQSQVVTKVHENCILASAGNRAGEDVIVSRHDV